MSGRKKENTISFRQSIDDDVYKAVYKICKRKGISVQAIVRLLLADWAEKNNIQNEKK